MSTALIVLAAGQGSRMNSDLPKVLHQVAGAPLLVHAMKSGAALAPERQVVVVGHGGAQVAEAARRWDDEIQIAEQTEQLGTAHAVAQARPALEGFTGDAIVLYGDTPFISPDTIEQMVQARSAHDVVILGFEAADPGRYGRLVMNGDKLERIVEFKDATEAERAITLCNSGVVCAKAEVLFDLIDKVGNDNASGEYYLTDIVGLAWDTGRSATAVTCAESETMGVNTRAQLAEAEAEFQSKMRAEMLDNGITMTAPETVFFAHDTIVGRDTIIEPNVVFGPEVTVESGATIRAFSHLEGCHVSRGAIIGPYARLRPGAEISEHAHIGNFVEVKNAMIGEGAKANHLTYIGDATIGKGTNIGAGTITCNYDGFFKHHTEIGENAFIGSSTMLVAPVRVGHGAMTGSGSVVTTDVEDGALALGRAKQVNKPKMAFKLMDMLRAKKAAAKKETN
ncbi:bifunctional UDP-N-acetylglucosamine diphosphorylase/glucosamine-1-phosphate N-acetyltransferase GlmU [Donghicola sp.]|jgi:bifunctional UDP-N-acetylglucosamine pyrophosphorylase/glucosamine-1-phosphate N-acetyltransferase|uniref:bifunctional UDP-N-acetylglucosamine diphosphorylase/glucosamine-1-phosphate N-acetyltransferase GlmU n=1 Tax=Donghicola sp. TaxID=1929294 RepID=UPI0025E4779D|nr:bifunctional UDP-N-acetylglucosamine diphosphorylase/glucosamine-1-phosphate N-acetyltransferase GlmU [Donghicola sp.]MCT4576956.1 bifunctional UDP-N-acetylglucosamine diphosphorylase/glucosamine-1-phosphate N-acetyltransferase GlmU [Donghicola sp.]